MGGWIHGYILPYLYPNCSPWWRAGMAGRAQQNSLVLSFIDCWFKILMLETAESSLDQLLVFFLLVVSDLVAAVVLCVKRDRLKGLLVSSILSTKKKIIG